MTAESAFTLNQVTFGYHADAPVVREINAQLEPGRITALIGPNAAGKSTLLRLMLGQLDPWSGSVMLDGWPVGSMNPKTRAQAISYVPQHGGASFAFTVRQVVAMGRYAHGDDRGIDEALAACDLAGLAERVFSDLSGGQQQRVLIARAMAQSSGAGRVMLLDEPSSSLDLRHVGDLMTLLRRQADRGLAVLVVLHDLNVAARHADRVWLMDQGRIVTQGKWETVMRPEVLEPVYRVTLEQIASGRVGRPVFVAEPVG